ncbi:hypothetical protein [Desulfovibrio sp. JC010]|uniref:hypothetical protein n=1 Tax=Desulfovibrio sp. JC010 TaxID=2593641 RepID=UPI0013CF80CE|nr:hypothetical protein [Desulfovibrio sp. JC010]NDV27727.1 hypothetical protein [Desulfovibrio sp. JC010]
MSKNPVTREEWADLRTQSMQEFPDVLQAGGSKINIFLDYQKEAHLAIEDHPLTVISKSRRIGLTWGIGSTAVLTSAATKSAGGMDTLYIGYNLDMAREFIDVCAMWAKAFNQAASDVEEFVFTDDGNAGDRDIKAFRINFASGFEIIALSSRPRSLRGRQGLVIIDEAGFHDDLRELIKAAMALLIWGGKVVVISTHDGDGNPFNELCDDIRSERRPGKLVEITFDDALKDGLYQRICLITGEEWSPEKEAEWRQDVIDFYGEDADEELFCIPSKGSGVYLNTTLIEARAVEVPVIELALEDAFTFKPEEEREAWMNDWLEENILPLLEELPKGLNHCFGEDFARVGDLTSIWPITIKRNLRRFCPFLFEMRNVPFEQQKQALFYIVDRLPRFQGGAMDATGNGSYLAEVAAQRYGEGRIKQIHLSDKFYSEHMPKFRRAFEDDMTTVPKNADVVMDHRAIKKVNGVPKVPRGDRTIASGGKGNKKRHGDSAIAHFLGYYATLECEGYQPMKYTPVKSHTQTRLVRTGLGIKGHKGLW